jgi:hypothetical protein
MLAIMPPTPKTTIGKTKAMNNINLIIPKQYYKHNKSQYE